MNDSCGILMRWNHSNWLVNDLMLLMDNFCCWWQLDHSGLPPVALLHSVVDDF